MKLTDENLKLILRDRPFRFYPAIESTNDAALNWMREGAEDGSMVITDHQTSGKGRRGRIWYTPPSSALTFSLILFCEKSSSQQCTMLAAVSVYEMLKELGIQRIGIKWPNDILVENCKVCGILSEALWSGGQFIGVVVGIGINISIDFSGTQLSKKAISLRDVVKTPIDPTILLNSLLDKFDSWRVHLGTPKVFQEWRNRLIGLGRLVKLEHVSGIAKSVDESGALRLELDDGQEIQVLAGTLQIEKDIE